MSTKWTLLLLVAAGCSVNYPAEWAGRAEPPEAIVATPGVMFGIAPISWDLAGGERIRIDVARADVTSGMGTYESEIRFTAAYGDSSDARIVCATEPSGPGVPRTRFGCWSDSPSAGALHFWMAPGRNCPGRGAAVKDTLTAPECWDGQVDIGGQQIQLSHGNLDSTGSPVGYISWIRGERHELLLAADIVSSMRIDVFNPRPGRPIDAELRSRLVLLTVALSWWEQASSPG